MSSKIKESRNTLGGITANFDSVFIELTLNHPRTALFTKMLSTKQKRHYLDRYYVLKCLMGIGCYDEEKSQVRFEFCDSGHVHLHAAMYFNPTQKINHTGFVADIVKLWLSLMPKAHSKYCDANMYHFDDGVVYKCPSIKCAIRSIKNTKRINEWETYINKYN